MRQLLILILFSQVLSAEQKISSVGSDTLNNMMTHWAESYEKKNPRTKLFIEGKGSSTAFPALIKGISDIGPMSRLPKKKELEPFRAKYKDDPIIIPVAFDAMALFVHKDNPVAERGLSLAEADAMFSSTRNHGHPNDITRWGQVNLKGKFANKKVVSYGKNSASSTYGFFQKIVLAKGSFKRTVKEQPSGGVVNHMANDINGIGYSGIGYRTSRVKPVPIIVQGKKIDASYENCINGKYPLARKLYLVLKPKPSPQVKNFLKFVLSKEGQLIVQKDGYYHLHEKEIAEQLKKLE